MEHHSPTYSPVVFWILLFPILFLSYNFTISGTFFLCDFGFDNTVLFFKTQTLCFKDSLLCYFAFCFSDFHFGIYYFFPGTYFEFSLFLNLSDLEVHHRVTYWSTLWFVSVTHNCKLTCGNSFCASSQILISDVFIWLYENFNFPLDFLCDPLFLFNFYIFNMVL